jgi:hypothetical protein
MFADLLNSSLYYIVELPNWKRIKEKIYSISKHAVKKQNILRLMLLYLVFYILQKILLKITSKILQIDKYI